MTRTALDVPPVATEPDSGRIPEGWAPSTLGEIGEYLNGRAFKKTEWSDEGRPIIRIQDLTGSNNNPNYFEGAIEDRYVVRPGDLLVSWSATLGAYLWNGSEGVLNQHIFKVRSFIDPKFHFFLMQHVLSDLSQQTHGSGMEHITKSRFRSTPITVPPLAEQRRIVDRVESLTSNLRSGRESLHQTSQTMNRFEQAVLAAACFGQLSGSWRSENEDADSIEGALANIIPNKWVARARRAHVDLQLPDLPSTYLVSTIAEVATVLEYGTSQKATTNKSFGIPVLRMGNIQDGELDYTALKYVPLDAETSGLLLEEGDLLFNRTNSPELVGKSAVYRPDQIEPTTFASYLIRVRFHPEVADPDFANFWINSAWGQAWARRVKSDGVSQSNISGTKLAAMPVPLPSLEEQREIVRVARKLISEGRKISDRIDVVSQLATNIRRSVLTSAFSGELATAEAKLARAESRDYEPADQLLQRIRSSGGSA